MLRENPWPDLSSLVALQEFILPAEVVDLYLIAKYTPIRIDGERGEPSCVASKSTVQSE